MALTVSTPVPPMPAIHHVKSIADGGYDGFGKFICGGQVHPRRESRAAAFHRNKRRTEAVHAREIFVASGLIDLSLATQFGLQRLDREAIGLDRTVAAAALAAPRQAPTTSPLRTSNF